MEDYYTRLVLNFIPRVISNLDRDPNSPTYGSFDRNYWLYKIVDFQNAILQQSCLTLALIYSHNFKGNIYYNNPRIKEWSIASIKYWSSIQHKDGSFDEYWKNEHGLPPTAFSVFAVSESLKLLQYKDKKVMHALYKSVSFLKKNTESFACNQEIASLCAIYSLFTITNDPKLLEIFNTKLKNLKNKQSPEGFFYEQNGADIGYLTVSINYLAILFKLSGLKIVKDMCDEAINFLSYFVHPDGSLGGEYGSRNTEYILPAGLEIMSKESSIASSILIKTSDYFYSNFINFPIDDRYLLHYVGPSYVIALNNCNNKKKQEKLPFQKRFVKYFKDAGLVIISKDKCYLIVNIKKGGVLKLYSKNKLLVNDLGYRIKNSKGVLYFSEYGDEILYFKFKNKERTELVIKKKFSKKQYIVINPIKRFVLSLSSLILGKFVRKMIKKSTLMGAASSKFTLLRFISVTDNVIEIIDQVNPRLSRGEELYRIDSQSIKVIPSSKFFQISELDNKLKFQKIIRPSSKIKTIVNLNQKSVNISY